MATLKRGGNALTEQDKVDIRRDIGLGTAATRDAFGTGTLESTAGAQTKADAARDAAIASAAADATTKADAAQTAAALDATTKATAAQNAAIATAAADATTKAAAAQTAAIAAAAADATSKADAAAASSIPQAQKGAVNGVASLDNTGKVPSAQLPSLATVATTGAYADLTGTPTLGTAAPLDVASTGDASSTQVVKGNDSRLSDAREWTAATIDQAEAEAGTATTRRAWTAQRVWQAIGAWWLSVSTAAGRALVTAADAAAQRAALGLGTAATTASSDYATAAQGVLAGSALQSVKTLNGTTITGTGDVTLPTVVDDVGASRNVTAADAHKVLRCTTAVTLTIPAGLAPNPTFIVIPPASGNVTIAVSGGAEINAATTSITRSRVNNRAGFAVSAYGANSYGVSGL